jgi:GDP-mannose 6-dehydrogenase
VKVAVFGLGYVGTVTAACLAERGNDVWGVDVDPHKIEAVATGHSTVMEPGLEELVARAVAGNLMHATADAAVALAGAQVSLICVGTPSAPNGSTDLSYIVRATETIAATLKAMAEPPASHIVAIRSTVPPGTVEELVRPVLDAADLGAVGIAAGTAMCPEFLREGSAVADFFEPPFTVIGTAEDWVAEALSALLTPSGEESNVVATRTAEALKYSCNAFHALKVAFANEIARVFKPLGIDSREVMSLFVEDRRLNISPAYLRPGFAFGGPCLPKDLRELLHLGRMNSVDLPVLSGTLSSNEICLADVIDAVVASEGMSVALLGLSFKPSSDDLRESPSVRLAEALVGKGYDLRIHDPVVNPAVLVGTNLRYIESKLPHLGELLANSAAEALEGADIAIVVSSDPAVCEALVNHKPARIIDLNGRLGVAVEALPGYCGAGW